MVLQKGPLQLKLDFANLMKGKTKTAEKLQWMKNFYHNEYIQFIINQYLKLSTHLSERPSEGSTVLFRRPQVNSKNDLLALGRVLSVSKEIDSSIGY